MILDSLQAWPRSRAKSRLAAVFGPLLVLAACNSQVTPSATGLKAAPSNAQTTLPGKASTYVSELVGFELELPAGWRLDFPAGGRLEARHGSAEFPGTAFFSHERFSGWRLSVRPTTVSGELLDPMARGRLLVEDLSARGHVGRIVPEARVTNETNAVAVEYSAGGIQGIAYSIAHEGIEYQLSFSGAMTEEARAEYARIAESLRFPSTERAHAVAADLAPSLTPAQRVLDIAATRHEIMISGMPLPRAKDLKDSPAPSSSTSSPKKPR